MRWQSACCAGDGKIHLEVVQSTNGPARLFSLKYRKVSDFMSLSSIKMIR